MAYARSYIWDPLGNKIKQYDSGVLTQSTFNKANQLVVSTPASGPTTTSTYDAVGNTIGINTGGALTTQTWSAENRMLSYADSSGNNEQFLYADDGLRKKRVSGAATTLFTYDETALLLETNTSNVLQARYTNSPETWGGLASQSRSGVSSFYGFDTQQCARILVSAAGVITDSYSYKVFGEQIQSGSGTVNPYRYVANGLYYFELADLVNAWSRWLKPSVGRWDSRDMLGFDSGDWNPYRYVGNNPPIRRDPEGTMPTDVTCMLVPLIKAYLAFGDVCRNRTQFAGPALKACMDQLCKKPFNIVPLSAIDPRCTQGLTPGQKYRCGLTMNGATNTIYLCPMAFNEIGSQAGGCDCVGRTIMHEMCHVCNHAGMPAGGDDEKYCEDAAANAWGFNATIVKGLPDCHGNNQPAAQ